MESGIPPIASDKDFNIRRAAGATYLALVVVLDVYSSWSENFWILAASTIINLIIGASVYFNNDRVVRLWQRIAGGTLLCMALAVAGHLYVNVLIQMLLAAYLLLLINQAPELRKWRMATTPTVGLCGLIIAVSFVGRETKRADLFYKVDEYNRQLETVQRAINWKNVESYQNGLVQMDAILKEKSPWLDLLVLRVERSLLRIGTEDKTQNRDTLQFISWHRTYLEGLRYQKNLELAVDSICQLLRPASDSVGVIQQRAALAISFARFRMLDSSIRANKRLDDSLRTRVKEFKLAE